MTTAIRTRLWSLMTRPRQAKPASSRSPDPAAESFGARLTRLRKARGLAQGELAERVGVSQAVLCYYEKDGRRRLPPELVSRLSTALGVSLDELLATRAAPPPDPAARTRSRLWKRLLRIEELPPSDQKTILQLIDALLARKKPVEKRA